MTSILKIHHIRCMQELAFQEEKIQALPQWLSQLTYLTADLKEYLDKIHVYYCIFKQNRLLAKATHDATVWESATYGAALQVLADSHHYSTLALNLILIVKCAEDLLEKYSALQQAYINLKDAYQWRYPVYIKNSLVSPESVQYFYVQSYVSQILVIMRCALRVLWQITSIGLCLQDSYLLFNGHVQSRYIACTELFTESLKYQEQRAEQQEILKEKLKNGIRLCGKIFSSQKEFESISSLENFIPKLEETSTEELIDQIFNTLQKLGKIQGPIISTVRTVCNIGHVSPVKIQFVPPPKVPSQKDRYPKQAAGKQDAFELSALEKKFSSTKNLFNYNKF